ncbi:MAG: hypothetical protein JWR36_1158, partial [Glaciihabitans sp.]|nr:hypothetical protein [Glaciihabitans sp.]
RSAAKESRTSNRRLFPIKRLGKGHFARRDLRWPAQHEGSSARVVTQGDDPVLYFTTSAPKAVRDAVQQEFGSRIVVGFELITAV